MKRIKIIRIIARLNIGGPAIHTVLLSEGLDKGRFDSLLICGPVEKTEGDMLYYAREKNVRPYFIPELTRRVNPLNDCIAFLKVYNIIKCTNPDIIHTHTAKAGTIGRVAGIMHNLLHLYRKKRIKLVHTFHGHVFEGYFNVILTRVFIAIERMLALFTDRIITVSATVKQELLSLGICREGKIEVIPLGLELQGFLNLSLTDRKASKIGMVGRLVPIKNHSLFIRAAGVLIGNPVYAGVEFYIVGDGELRMKLEAYAQESGINNRIHFLGWQRSLAEIYAQLDIVCLTSINEGTPVSLIEAMASARPVVATDAGGVRDLLGGGVSGDNEYVDGFEICQRGILVTKAVPETFASALSVLLEDSRLRMNMGQAGRGFVRNKFSGERLIKDIENLYGRILNGGGK